MADGSTADVLRTMTVGWD